MITVNSEVETKIKFYKEVIVLAKFILPRLMAITSQ